MAKRPVFIPRPEAAPFTEAVEVEFTWHPGLSRQQAQRSIASLHEAAAARGIAPVLEISSKSTEGLGIALSAFNLPFRAPDGSWLTVECAFQGSKVFERGGPYTELYSLTSKEAKTDERLRTSGELIGFRFFGQEFPTRPLTAFYDWLYLQALGQNMELARRLEGYAGFSDIVFNPERSLNCQARSAALFVALSRRGLLERALSDRTDYLRLLSG